MMLPTMTSTPMTVRSPAAFVTSVCALVFALSSLVPAVTAATMDDWRSRSIYQVIVDRFALTNGSTDVPCDTAALLYCGGSFQGIINQLDYIQGMGFTAVWVSPVVTNIDIPAGSAAGEAYHGYWSQDIYTINSNLGTSDDLKALSKALHDRDMYFMLDIVMNNMAFNGAPTAVDYSIYTPFDNQDYFHTYCPITNYTDDTNAAECWLGTADIALPDLNTDLDDVQQIWHSWGVDMVSNYSIDGFRLDAAKHIQKSFWPGFQDAVGIFTIGEVDDDTAAETCPWLYQGLDAVLNYPMWYSVGPIFGGNESVTLQGLQYTTNDIQEDCMDPTMMGTFSSNQDVNRIAYYTSDMVILKNIFTWNFFTDGIPIVYYGDEQALNATGDPENRQAMWLTGYDTTVPLYQTITIMNKVRNAIAKTVTYSYWSAYWTWKSTIVLSKNDLIAIRKGYDLSMVAIVTKGGTGASDIGPYDIGDTNFLGYDTIIEVFSCDSQKVGPYGDMSVTVKGGLPQLWVSAHSINTTDLCPDAVKSALSADSIATSAGSSTTAPFVLSLLTIAFVVMLL